MQKLITNVCGCVSANTDGMRYSRLSNVVKINVGGVWGGGGGGQEDLWQNKGMFMCEYDQYANMSDRNSFKLLPNTQHVIISRTYNWQHIDMSPV